jgi:hypothetical protein
MNEEQRLALISEVVELVASETNLRDEDSFGDDMAELILAITGPSSTCELYKNSEIQYDFWMFLGEHFEPEHPVWNLTKG